MWRIALQPNEYLTRVMHDIVAECVHPWIIVAVSLGLMQVVWRSG